MNRSRLVLAVLFFGVAAAVGSLFFVVMREVRLTDWIGSQVRSIVNSRLVPQLEFDELHYRAPYHVRLENAALVSPDGVTVFRMDRLELTLADRPRTGKPIIIEKLILDHGEVRLIADGDGGFRGLSPFTRGEPTPEAQAIPLSDVLRLRSVEIRSIDFLFDPAGDAPSMELPGIAADLTLQPDADEPGWYAARMKIGRAPALELSVDGRINLDTLTADIKNLSVELAVDPTTLRSLPPDLQQLLARHEASGFLSAKASGLVSLTQPSRFRAAIELTDFNISAGDFRLPIDAFTAEAILEGDLLTFEGDGRLLGGAISIPRARLTTDGPAPAFSLPWRLDGIDLYQLVRSADSSTRLAGTLDAVGTLDAAADDVSATINGQGEVHVRDGTLLILPGFSTLTSLIGGDDTSDRAHHLDARFTLSAGGAELTGLQLATPVLAARAEGTIGYDGKLDLVIHAGPLEKLQNMLGDFGEMLAVLTDNISRYRMEGTVSEPSIIPAPFGVGG